MTESTVQPDCEAVLAHTGWVRVLARRLTRDAHLADDLAQDALAAACVKAPPSDRPLRDWLAGIVRNLARQERREASNRTARERCVARAEADGSHEQLFEQLDLHRAVVDAVARLDEPYRAAILMRYFEGLAPAAIAARTRAPLRTVHTRLHRALARLRVELDRGHGGDRRTWLLALIPFARGSERWSSAAIGALVMEAKTKVALAAIVAVCVGSTWLLWPSGTPAVSSAGLAQPTDSVRVDTPSRPAEVAALDGAREAVDRTERVQPPTAPPPPPAATASIAGRVIDLDRAPVEGLRVRFYDAARRAMPGFEATTGADGAFAIDDPRVAGLLDVDSRVWTTVFRPELLSAATSPSEPHVLVVARSIALGGTVVDEQHRAVEAAKVEVSLPRELRARFGSMLDRSSTVDRRAVTDALGHFELAGVPLVPETRLATSHAAYLADDRTIPEHDELALEIQLRSAHTEPDLVVGRVVDLTGEPVEGAWVALGSSSAKSGARGEFALHTGEAVDAPGGATLLRAVKSGFLPAELEQPASGAWPDPLVLELGEPALSIAGRVVDADGNAVPGASVWSDETRFGYIDIEGGEMSMRAGASVEGILRGDPWKPRTRANGDGRFELKGLVPRDYRVTALDARRLLVVTATVAAGAREVELKMPSEPLHERVAGRVTNLAGGPLAGLDVVLEREPADGSGSPFARLAGRAVKTDAEGRFEFKDVSRALARIRVSGDELPLDGVEFPISAESKLDALVLAVPVRVHAQIDAGPESDFDSAALLDEHGEKLELSVHHGKSAYAMLEIQVHGAQTESFSVAENAATLVLYKGGVELRRQPVKLVPGQLNTLRP